jgi:virginiamycin B lyase
MFDRFVPYVGARGETMRISKLLTLMGLIVFLGSVCYGGTITGTVTGPDSKPFQGAFVEAQNRSTKITVIVLSDSHGRYRIEGLPAGEYRVQIRAVGYRADARTGVNLVANQNGSFDFALQKDMVHWSDISLNQAKQLWPTGKGEDVLFKRCSICHGFQSRIASVTRDEEGWRDRIEYMRTAIHWATALVTDQDAADLASYLASLFGPNSVLPKSPSDMAGYQNTLRPFSSEAMNIVYVEYDMPGPNRMPFSAAPDKDGYLWIPNSGIANKITRLDPKTGNMQDFTVPNVGPAGVHSAIPASDGSVWLAEQGANKIGKWDSATQKITEYQDAYLPGKEGISEGGQKHTLRLDPSGNVWSSGVPLTRFDPETKKFTRFNEVAESYDVKPDQNGDVWFCSLFSNKVGKVDGKTMKVSQWTPPTPGAGPRRVEIGPDGIIWSGEYNAGKMARFDPKSQSFKEYPLPGPDASPYGMGFDADGYLWYDSHNMDVIGRFDTKTGKVTEYPFPHPEIAIREFFRDSEGRMWYGTSPNNKVGYFYLTGKTGGGARASN